MAHTHDQLLQAAIDAVAAKKPKEVFFVACGGSMAYMYNQQFLFDTETAIPTSVLTSNEFIHRNLNRLGNESLVVLCSHSGNTPETVAAAEYARSKGALTVAYSHKIDSPLWNEAEYGLHYDWGPESDAYEHKSGTALRFIFGVLNALESKSKFARALEVVRDLNPVFEANRKKFADSARTFGSDHKRDDVIYTMGSGPVFGEVYAFSACLMQEMQWIHSGAIHSGEYFHGPFEITDFDVPFLIAKTYGRTRPLDERAERFARKYSDRVTVVDANEFEWGPIDEELREFFSVPVFNAVLRTYAEQLAEHRGHPLSVRRYMWKLEY